MSALKVIVLYLATVVSVSSALQIPFQRYFQQGGSRINAIDNTEYGVHYTQIEESSIPIDLSQYDQKFVIRVADINSEALKVIRDSKKNDIELNTWGKSNKGKYLDVEINQINLDKLLQKIPDLEYSIIIEDLAQKIFETYPQSKLQAKGKPSLENNFEAEFLQYAEQLQLSELTDLFFQDYRSLETIYSWLELLSKTFPEALKVEEIGQTFEHRSYKVVHFSIPGDEIEHEDRKVIVITGGVHAREWISISSVLYLLFSMINYYQQGIDSHDVLTKLDFLFVPVSNPDGYAYTWTSDRLWRKNRQETVIPTCFGIDIDHSYDFHWKNSDWPCGEEYSGEVPFEAIESKIWLDYLNSTNHDHRIAGYIDLHSYSQEVLFPYAYSCNHTPRNEENLIELAYGIAKAIRLQSGKRYDVLPACVDKDADLLPDMGSGSSLDFMYHNKAYFAYQLKLRDSGNHGFLLPSRFIEPVGKEIFAGIKYFSHFLVSED